MNDRKNDINSLKNVVYRLPALKMFVFFVCLYLLLDLVDISDLGCYVLIGLAGLFSIFVKVREYKYVGYLVVMSSLLILISPRTELNNYIIDTEKAVFSGRVVDVLRDDDFSVKMIAEGRIDSKNMEEFRSKIYLKYYKNSPINVSVGDEIYANIDLLLPKKKQLYNEFDEELYLKSRGVTFVGKVNKNSLAVVRNGSGFRNYVESLNKEFSRRIDDIFSDEAGSVIKAMILGDKSEIDIGVRNKFSFTGTAHILAISGLHVGIIAAILFFLLTPISNQKFRIVIFSLLLISFIVISGMQASAIRAGGMAIAFYYTLIIQRKVEPLNLLGIVSLIYFIINPLIIYSLSFQMSFLAVMGIFLFYSRIYDLLNRIIRIRFVSASLSVTISTSIFLFPVIAYHFNTVAFVSFLANMVIVPIASIGLIYSILGLGFSYLSGFISGLFAMTTEVLFDMIFWLNDLFFNVPGSFYKGEYALYISLIIVFLIVVVLYSRIRQLYFRVSVGIIIFSLIYLHISRKNEVDVYSDNRINCIEVPLDNGRVLYYISDRYGKQYPINYWSLNEKIITDRREIIVGYNGNQGINLGDRVKGFRRVMLVEFGIEEEGSLQGILMYFERISQIN